MNTTSGPRNRGPLAVLSYAAFAALLVAWFFTLAPTTLGGPATFALVDGHSMEPMLHTGDLAVAHRQAQYVLGDLVVYQNSGGRNVIHRLIGGDAASGWQSQGDHNSYVDPWIVPDAAIMGTYWFEVPQLANVMAWSAGHPWGLGLICALVAMLAYVPWRRRKVSPTLAAALATATKEPRREGRTGQEYGVLALSGIGAFVSLALVGVLGTSHNLMTMQGVIAMVTLAWTGGATLFFVNRLFDGRGVQEPDKSHYALSGRLWMVAELPVLPSPAAPVRSALELRKLAEKYRLPVLHRIDPVTGAETFLLLTDGRGAYVWQTVGKTPATQPA